MNVIPYRNLYVEPFTNSFSTLLSRKPSNIEVCNDEYNILKSYLSMVDNEVERSNFLEALTKGVTPTKSNEVILKWFRIVMRYSNIEMEPYWDQIYPAFFEIFFPIHERLKYVIFESDWRHIISKYDSRKTVFFMTPINEDPAEVIDWLPHIRGCICLMSIDEYYSKVNWTKEFRTLDGFRLYIKE